MAELKLEHIQKKYDKDVLAVKDFNLHIQDKEFIVFVLTIRLRKIDDSAYDCRPRRNI